MRENKIEKWYVSELKKRNVDCLKTHVKSWPDRLCVADFGSTCWIEFKRTGRDIIDPHQSARRRRLESMGHTVFGINRISEIELASVLNCLGVE